MSTTPAAAATPATGRLPLAAITPSTTNPRKHFDKVALEELAESIRRHDVVQAILVRPNGGPGKFQLVAGERRYRAAKMAGLTDIPATSRELSDADVLEIQVIENLQRQDLHELEEAEGYEQLMKCARGDGKKYSAEEIAAKVGKSRSYVFARMKLVALCPEARKVFSAREIDASKALLIARIGHHDTQRQAMKDIMQGRYGNGEPMSYREAHQHILRTYMLVLKEAPFDTKDEKLLPKAGACGPCPKRTGNQSDLFGDVKSADVCTDPKCFDDKRQAHYSVAVKGFETKGEKVVSGDAAKKAMPNWDNANTHLRDMVQGGYVKLDDTSYASGRGVKVKDILGKEYRPILLQHPGTGEIIKVATQQAVAAASQKTSKQRSSAKSKSGPKKPREIVEPPPSPDVTFRRRLFLELCAKLPTSLGKEELALIAREAMALGEEAPDLVADALLPPRKDGKKRDIFMAENEIEAVIPKLDTPALARLTVALLLSREVEDGHQYIGGKKQTLMLDAAKRWKVDAAKVKKTIQDEAKAAAAKAPAKPVAKKATKKSAKK